MMGGDLPGCAARFYHIPTIVFFTQSLPQAPFALYELHCYRTHHTRVCWEIILLCSWVYFGVLGCTWVCKKITGSKQELLSFGECFVAGPFQSMPRWSICLMLVKKMTAMTRLLLRQWTREVSRHISHVGVGPQPVP